VGVCLLSSMMFASYFSILLISNLLSFDLSSKEVNQSYDKMKCSDCNKTYFENFDKELKFNWKDYHEKCNMCIYFKEDFNTSELSNSNQRNAAIDWVTGKLADLAGDYYEKYVQHQQDYSASIQYWGGDGGNSRMCSIGMSLQGYNDNVKEEAGFGSSNRGSVKTNEIKGVDSQIRSVRFETRNTYVTDIKSICFGFGSRSVFGYKSAVCITGDMFDACKSVTNDQNKFNSIGGNDYNKHLQIGWGNWNIHSIDTQNPAEFVAKFQNINGSAERLRDFCYTFNVNRSGHYEGTNACYMNGGWKYYCSDPGQDQQGWDMMPIGANIGSMNC